MTVGQISKVPMGVAKIAKKYEKPVLAFSGCVAKEAVACNAEGIDAFFPILRNVVSLDEAIANMVYYVTANNGSRVSQ